MTDMQVHHQTRRGADIALAKKQISQESYRAVLAGTLTLAEAKELGRQGAPNTRPQPTSRISKDDRSRECMCGCGSRTKGRFAQGHDMRLATYAKEYVRGERDLSPEQLEYVEHSGKLERAREQIAREEERRRERIARKTERQGKREGETERTRQQRK